MHDTSLQPLGGPAAWRGSDLLAKPCRGAFSGALDRKITMDLKDLVEAVGRARVPEQVVLGRAVVLLGHVCVAVGPILTDCASQVLTCRHDRVLHALAGGGCR